MTDAQEMLVIEAVASISEEDLRRNNTTAFIRPRLGLMTKLRELGATTQERSECAALFNSLVAPPDYDNLHP